MTQVERGRQASGGGATNTSVTNEARGGLLLFSSGIMSVTAVIVGGNPQ